MAKFNLNPDQNPILPGMEEEGGVAVEVLKEPEEVKVKFADPNDGLDEKCSVCGDHGCPQCGGGRGK